jgi:hypothetical protein
MEYNRAVLEFFDQPCQLELANPGPSGRPTRALHTPDFLVLHTDGASLEEWKPEEKLLELMVTHPGRYQRDDSGHWRCPPGEEAAASLGLSYRVRSSAELHSAYIRNLVFLEDSFFEGSIGCIGILKQWLVRALYRALREGSDELTRAHLEQSVLPDAKWERMRADARSGEAEFRYANEQNSYLSNLARMPTFVPKQPDPASPSPPEDGTAEQKKGKPKRRVGEPSPRRDQVGTAQQEADATHCSFSGSIKLEVVRWLESNVQEVQCSTCGSVSKAKLKEQSVVIAPHPPRKSRPVRNVTRWVEQGAQWVLIQKKEASVSRREDAKVRQVHELWHPGGCSCSKVCFIFPFLLA